MTVIGPGIVVGGGITIESTANVPPPAAGQNAIFGYGYNGSSTYYSMTNLVSNTGVVATDTAGVGTARMSLAAAIYN